MIKFPKLLVMGNSLIGANSTSSFLRGEILKHYPKDRYICFATESHGYCDGEEPQADFLRGVPCLIGPLVPRLQLRGARFYMPLLRFIGFRLIAPWRIRQIVNFGKQHGVGLIWAELQGDVIVLSERVAEKMGVPFAGSIWDDPESWLSDGGYDGISQQFILRRFRTSLRTARSLSTAGEAMQRTYERDYGVKSVILRHGFEKIVLPTKNYKRDDNIIVGFVGSVYGRDAWEAFLSGIAGLNALRKFPPIQLRVFGRCEFPYQYNGIRIEARGWQPADLMLREIAETDFCYLPYWFEPRKRRHVELSFPNKFETYLAAGRPVLYHGPDYAGIAETIKKYRVGLCVHSLDQDQITSALERLIIDSSLRDSLRQAANAAFHAEFNADVMMRNFAEMIGVDPNAWGEKEK
jgi:glycosyltransferase involved in cell wall biosynthesis